MGRPQPSSQGIQGRMSDLYDVFVDWEGRLGREMPAIEQRLGALGARRILDVGCGTGRHVAALRAAGFEAHGADVSDDMLAQARALLGGDEGLHRWRLGDAEPASLAGAGPFDALLALGNVWPQVLSEDDARRSGEAFLRLLAPGGLLLFGMKAVALREQGGGPYMPLLRRVHEGRPLWFVRFVDFEVPRLADGTRVCDFHMVVVGGSARGEGGEREALLHRAGRLRVWDPEELATWFRAAGFEQVRVAGRLADPEAPATTEDVFLSARSPGGDRDATSRA